MKHLESLQSGQGAPQLGASHAENTGLPFLGSGSEAGRAALAKFEAAGMVDGNLGEMGGGDIPEIHIPAHIKTLAVTLENFPNISPALLDKLRRKFPDGIPEIMGGQDDNQAAFLQMLNAFQSEKPFEVSASSARMRGIEASLTLRTGSSSKATEMVDDKILILQGTRQEIRMSSLATVHQIATTSPTPAYYRGDLLRQDTNGQPIVAVRGAFSPPQLVREFKVNDPDHGDQYVLCPLLPEKLELFAKDIQRRELGAPRQYTATEVERSRRQVSNHFAMLNLSRGLAGSLSQHDMLELQRTADRIMAGSHDETPVFKLIGMVPQVHAVLASDKIETLAQFYETHLTETRIFHAMRTTALAVGMQIRTPEGSLAEVSGTLALGDFMDQLLSSQKQLEQVMQGVTDAGPRMGVRGLISANPTNEGVVAEEGKLIWQVLADRLGLFDHQGNWVSMKTILFEGKDPSEMKWDELAGFTKNSILRTNIPDVEVMMPLTKESLGVYPIEENVPAAIYPLYFCAREFSRGLLLDLMMTPDFQGKAGKQVRKLRRWVYDVWTYWQARTGLNELQKTFPYKDFVSEKFIPALVEKTRIKEAPNWKEALRENIEQQGGVWLEAFDQYSSYTKLAKDVIATVFANPNLLPSRMPKVEGYITALALNTPSTTRDQKISVYKKQLHDEFVSNGQMGTEEFDRRVGEFERYLNYWQGGGPLEPQYRADMASGKFPHDFTLEQWLKHRITNERYASRSQRPGTLRTKEEMGAAVATLTEAERAVLDLSIEGERLVKFTGTPDKPGITDSMGIDFVETEGLSGLEELVQKFAWRNFPINLIPPRLVDGTSVGGYISDFVGLTGDTQKLIDGIGERKVQEKVTALPTTSENIDTGQMIGLAEKAADYILSTYHFVSYPHQRERAQEALKILLWATTPLKSSELVVSTMRAVPKGAEEPAHQEMFIPVNLFGRDQQEWLKGNSMRGSRGGGEKGMIFLSDFPARFRMRFGDVKNGPFKDMVDMAKECRQSLTVVGMERPNYNTIPWKKTLMTLSKRLRQGSGLTEKDMAELDRFADEHFDPAHREVSETGTQRIDRGVQDLLEILQVPLDLLSSLLGGGK